VLVELREDREDDRHDCDHRDDLDDALHLSSRNT
jgi:hypothetical protein